MTVKPITTELVLPNKTTLEEILSELGKLRENSIVAVTSKLVSICEGSIADIDKADKNELIRNEADYFLPREDNKFDVYLTIKNNMLMPSAGVDESNAGGYYVLLPENPQLSANRCREFLKIKYNLKNAGVIITDSIPYPLRFGVSGRAIAHSGFAAVVNKIGKHDLFGRRFSKTLVNHADGLAAAAVLCMGEAAERTPLAIIEDVPFVEFTDNPEIWRYGMEIDAQDDLYGQLLDIENGWCKRIKKEMGK